MVGSAALAQQIVVGGGYGAPPKAEIALAQVATTATIAVPANTDPIALARLRCGRATDTYIALLRAANADAKVAPSDSPRMMNFPACFVIDPQQKQATRLGSESLQDFAVRVLGAGGPDTLRALQVHNAGEPLAASGQDSTLAVPFKTESVVYALKPKAAADPQQAVAKVVAGFSKPVEASLVASTNPDDLRMMSGVVARKPVTCDETRAPAPDSDWPFNVAKVVEALSRNDMARRNDGMQPARTATVAVADNGVDGLQASIFTPSVLLINGGEVPGNHVDDDRDDFVDDVAGATVLSPIDPPIPAPPGALQDREHGTLMASLAIGGPAFRQATPAPAAARVLLLPISMVQRRVTTSPNGNVTSYGYPSQGLSAALRYAIDRRADVLNLSIGTTQRLSDFETLASQFNPIVIVAAAGNEATDYRTVQLYPASYGGESGQLLGRVITVGASDRRGCLADFSGRSAKTVDILAPGVSITASGLDGAPQTADGTSQATALVSFTVALLKSEGLTDPTAIKDRLFAAADRRPDLASFVNSGGILNIAKTISLHHEVLERADGAVVWGRLATTPQLTDLCDGIGIGDGAKGRILRIAWQGGAEPLLVLWRADGGARTDLSCRPVSTLTHLDFVDEHGAASTVPLDGIASLVLR